MHHKEEDIKCFKFPNFSDFIVWKGEEEAKTHSNYVLMCAPWTHQLKQHNYYYCNRSGKYVSKGKGQHIMKVQGSCKTGKNCLAYMKTVTDIENGSVQVQYYSCHNHEISLGHLKPSQSTQGKIVSQLQQGVPAENIMDMIRDSIPDGITREHIVTKQDIRNIQMQYNIQGDLTSVTAWVEEFRTSEHNPVLLFKPQGAEQGENMDDIGVNDFLLLIQTKFQLDMLELNGHKCICMDSTYGVNNYNFLLISVLVIYEYGEGIPVAWAITNHEDTAILIQYMKAMKEKISSLSPQWFMSDDADQFFNAFRAVFGKGQTNKVLCAWHLDRSWRGALRQHVKQNAKRVEIYHFLRVLLIEREEPEFRVKLQNF